MHCVFFETRSIFAKPTKMAKKPSKTSAKSAFLTPLLACFGACNCVF
jgi:hypothetical protein